MKKWIKELFCWHKPDLKKHGVWEYRTGEQRRILHCTRCGAHYASWRTGGYEDNDKRFKPTE